MLGNYLIGLREGLEAALVVSVLVAYLVKSGRRGQLVWIWCGLGTAVALSVAVTLALGLQSRQLTFRTQELLGGVLSIVAAVFVTWMLFWMAATARGIADELRGRLDATAGRWWPLGLVAFLAVGRRGHGDRADPVVEHPHRHWPRPARRARSARRPCSARCSASCLLRGIDNSSPQPTYAEAAAIPTTRLAREPHPVPVPAPATEKTRHP